MTRLEWERRRQGLSQTDLAARAKKLSAADVSRFERGWARPYPGQAERLAAALNVPVEDLMTEQPATGRRRAGVGARRRA